jgi:hypothetical protein
VTAAVAAIRRTAGGNSVLVGYVTGNVNPARVRMLVTERLPDGVAPLIVVLDSLPQATSGKLSRNALPWPAPARRGAPVTGGDPGATSALTDTAAWLAERWGDQLGLAPTTPESDFFELGGSSLAAAKLVSVLRERFPAIAVADVYIHRQLGELATRLDHLGEGDGITPTPLDPATSRWGLVQLAGVLLLIVLGSAQWLVGIGAYNHWQGTGFGSQISWGWLIAAWLVIASAPGRTAIVLAVRRVLLPHLKPGRYSRHSWLAWRLWFVERLAESVTSNVSPGHRGRCATRGPAGLRSVTGRVSERCRR